MTSKLFLIGLLLIVTICYPVADLVIGVPGYPSDFSQRVFSGYLETGTPNRSLHYVFVESVNPNNPVTLWLNGGPGCSSMYGFMQEIGPFYLEDGVNYKRGDKLTRNPFSWHTESHLLFIQSPGGVGYSYLNDFSFTFTDAITAAENLNALVNFFQKFNELTSNNFWISGQSYAGKYIPDLAVAIDKYNAKGQNAINLKGIMVGNGVMSFQNDRLQQSQIQYMINHEFVDPQAVPSYWAHCLSSLQDPLCQNFLNTFDANTQGLNPYNVYGYCFVDNDSQMIVKTGDNQQSRLKRVQKSLSLSHEKKLNVKLSDIPPCDYASGMINYFTIHWQEYHAIFKSPVWDGPCSDINYIIQERGSLQSYRYLLANTSIKLVLYNGDWDDVVPYGDTIKGLVDLKLPQDGAFTPWFTNKQHSGFIQSYGRIDFATVKGASHQVPQAKRAESLELFRTVLNSVKQTNLQIQE